MQNTIVPAAMVKKVAADPEQLIDLVDDLFAACGVEVRSTKDEDSVELYESFRHILSDAKRKLDITLTASIGVNEDEDEDEDEDFDDDEEDEDDEEFDEDDEDDEL